MIKSKSFFKVTSHGSQKKFMVAYKNTINFTNSSFKYWIGGLFTGGQIEANTIPAGVTLFAEDRLVILGIGTKYLQKIDNFSFKFYFDKEINIASSDHLFQFLLYEYVYDQTTALLLF